jgi:hypothetical protein
VCPRGGLDDFEKRKIPCRYRDLNPASFSRDNAVTVITTLTVTTTLTIITKPSRLVYFVTRNSMCVTFPAIEKFIMISYKWVFSL